MADKRSFSKMTIARELRVKTVVPQVAGLSDDLKNQLSRLDDDELAVLGAIKEKLNEGLSDELAQAVDTVGGFVW